MKTLRGLFCLMPGLMLLLLVSCSQEGPTVAGGSATDVADATGILYLDTGEPARHAELKLIAADIQVTDTAFQDSVYITTTDSTGAYLIPEVVHSNYNVLAHHPASGKRFIKKRVLVEGETVTLPNYTLTEPGTAEIFLQDSVQYAGTLVHFLGTDISRSIPQNAFAGGSFQWDSLPAGDLPAMWITWQPDGEAQSAALHKSVAIVSGQVAPVNIRSIHPLRTPTAPVIDGNLADFPQTRSLTLSNDQGTQGTYYFAWNDTALFIAARVTDATLNALTPDTLRDAFLSIEDGIELMIDTDNSGGSARDSTDYKFFVNILNAKKDTRRSLIEDGPAWNGTFYSQVLVQGTINDSTDTDVGYTLEIAIPFHTLGIANPSPGKAIGFELVCNDLLADGIRIPTVWANTNGDAIVEEGDAGIIINDPDGWGTMVLDE